jgi:hypothetical protein
MLLGIKLVGELGQRVMQPAPELIELVFAAMRPIEPAPHKENESVCL